MGSKKGWSIAFLKIVYGSVSCVLYVTLSPSIISVTSVSSAPSPQRTNLIFEGLGP